LSDIFLFFVFLLLLPFWFRYRRRDLVNGWKSYGLNRVAVLPLDGQWGKHAVNAWAEYGP
jgi:hypothetical protein